MCSVVALFILPCSAVRSPRRRVDVGADVAAALAVEARGSDAGAGGAGGLGRQHWGAEAKAWAPVSAGVGDGAGGAAAQGVLTRAWGVCTGPR